MTRLEGIPEAAFERHEEAGTLGDSEQIEMRDLEQFDKQLREYGLEVVTFENGAAQNWFIQPTGAEANVLAGLRYIGKLVERKDFLEDSEQKRAMWLRDAKEAAGYGNNVSFDVVWAEALAALNEKKGLK